jgi:penicillin amidase
MQKALTILSVIFFLTLFFILAFFQYTIINKAGFENIPSLSSKVNVHYDSFGVPHINAKNEKDVYRVLGYLTAADRLFQMDLLRRVVNGKLSEIFGEETLESDILLRKLRFKKNAEEIYKRMQLTSKDKKVLDLVSAYLEGVHYFIDTKALPLEFILLNYVPEKFEVSDVIGITGYMSLTFAEAITADSLLTELMETLPEDKMKVIRAGSEVDVDYFREQKVVETKLFQQVHKNIVKLKEYVPLFQGSNSWVLSGKRTQSGKPILANDPHIGVSSPHIFYEAHIKSPNLEVYGSFIPLLPFPVLGHTNYSAWGLTMSMVDDLNIYQEKIDAQDTTKVMYKNEWVDIEQENEIIKVKGQKDQVVSIKVTPHGPVLDESKFGQAGKNLSLSWSVYHPEDKSLRALYELPHAESVEEFKSALAFSAAPGVNVSWVHKDGDIAWWAMGKAPKLPEGVNSDLILRGWDGSADIERYYSIDENPHEVNPESGVIITANYRPQYEEFAEIDGYWQPGGRFFRIQNLLKQKLIWNVEDLKKIQLDNTIPISEQLFNQLSRVIKTDQLNEIELESLELLKNWDGKSTKQSVESSIYHMWNFYLSYNIFVDELGEKNFEIFGKTADFWHAFKFLIYNPNHSFWDNIRTNRVESGAEVVTNSFKDAISDLKENYGHRIKYWKWGKLHKAVYKHTLGKVKPLNFLYNRGPISADGGRYVINNMAHNKASKDFTVVHAPASRRIIDMGAIKKTIGIIPTGNSGNPFSKHYSDQMELYHHGKYRTLIMDWDILTRLPLLEFSP